MKGHIRERSPNRWATVIDLRDPKTGQRERKWHSFPGQQARRPSAVRPAVTEMKDGAYVEHDRKFAG